MKIAILNYSTTEVIVEDLPELKDYQSETVEEYLTTGKNYNLDEIHYMYGENIEVTID